MQPRAWLLILLISLATWQTSAAPTYAVAELPLPSGFVKSRGLGINFYGDVVGWAATEKDTGHAVLWRQGQVLDLGTMGAADSLAAGISDSGLVVGAFIRGGMRHVFLWRDGQFQELGPVDEWPGKGMAVWDINPGLGISRQGKVIGRIANKEGAEMTFVYENGQLMYLRQPKNGAPGFGRAINDQSQMAGQLYVRRGLSHALFWSNGAMQLLPHLAETIAGATAINEHSTVVGWAFVPCDKQPMAHAAIWRDGRVVDLGTLGGDTSRAYGLNDAGQVTGYSSVGKGEYSGFLWDNGRIFDLNDLVPSSLGYRVTCADAINNRGQIAAVCRKSGLTRACRLSPVETFVLEARARPRKNAQPPDRQSSQMSDRPKLKDFGFAGSGEFRLEFEAHPGDFAVETSTNLVRWTAIGKLQLSGDRLVIIDPQAERFPIRFYRVIPATRPSER